MFDDLISTLDSLGVDYTEDYKNNTLDIDIAEVDKDTLVSVITELNNEGLTFDITDSSITVQGTGEVEAPEEGGESSDAIGSALDQYGSEEYPM